MTDGIIQQVLEPYLITWHEIVLECRNEDPDSDYTKDAEKRLSEFMKIQQELIEKINKDLEYYANVSGEIDHKMQLGEIIQRLIGERE